MTGRTEPDRSRPETGRLDRTSPTLTLTRDLGHMTSRAARLRMCSGRITSGSRR